MGKLQERKRNENKKKTRKGRVNVADHPVSGLIVSNDLLVCQILSRLPVKSLTRFKCVSKSWKSIIEEDSHFRNLHLKHSQARPGLFIFLPKYEAGEQDQTRNYGSFMSADLSSTGNSANIHTISKTDSFSYSKILGPIMGLVCFVGNCAVRIYNVSTGEATPWIKSSVCIHHAEKRNGTVKASEEPGCYFGFDPATRKHKVIFMWCEGKFKHVPVCEVLTVGENTWRIVNDVPPCKPAETIDTYVTYANGSIYWYLSHSSDDYKPRFEYSDGEEVIEYSNESIMAFDIGSEKFRLIPIPEFTITNLKHADIRLYEVDDCLAILRWKEPIIKLWIFHDHNKAAYGIANTRRDDWTQETITLPSYLSGNQRIIFFHFVAGKDQVILETYNRDHLYYKSCGVDRNARLSEFYSYDRKDKRVRKFKINGISLVPEVLSSNTLCTTHVESLSRVTETELSSHVNKPTFCWCHHC